MTAHRKTALASVVTLALAGCAGGAGGGGSPPANVPVITVSGTVSGAISAGVAVALRSAGSLVSTTITTGSGTYSFAGVADGDYTIQPTLSGYTFDPPSRAVHVAGADVAGQDFSGAAVAAPHAISGTVSGAVQAGVTVTLSGDANMVTTTAANGSYAFAGLADGSYTVAPSRGGYVFTPVSLGVTVAGADVTGRDFVASATNLVISGAVTGAVQQGVTVTLSGDAAMVTSTAANGTYAFSGLASGSYLVTPSRAGLAFSPASRPVTLAAASATGHDFTATLLPPLAVTVVPGGAYANVVWTPNPAASTYKVYFGQTPALTSASPFVSSFGPGHVVQGLANGVRHWFAVSAVAPGGESALTAPRCAVPTVASQIYANHVLDLYDGLCDDRLDHTRWHNPGAWSAAVTGGAAELSADADHMESRYLRNHRFSAGATVAAARVTKLSSLVEVPAATASRTGGAFIRAAVRIVFQPPALRLQEPAPDQDLLVLEAGLEDLGGGLQAFRRIYHCADGHCLDLDDSGIAVQDPDGFTSIADAMRGAPATHDTPYRVTVEVDESTSSFAWSIQGGPEFTSTVAGTADPTAYLAATPAWSGIGLAAGGNGAQIMARVGDRSLGGGGSARVTARFRDVWVGLAGGAAAPWDDFSGSGGNSGPAELSLARWSGVGAGQVMPSGSGDLVMSSQGTSAGAAQGLSRTLTLANPEAAELLQADVAVPAFVATTLVVTGAVQVEGRFHNDGTGTAAGDATGDIHAAVIVSGPAMSSSYLIYRCGAADCSSGTTLASAAFGPPLAAPLPVTALRVGYDRTADQFVFGVGTATTTRNAAPIGASRAAPARAPMKRVRAVLSLPAAAGTGASAEARVGNVFVGKVRGAPVDVCTSLDPGVASTVELQYVAAGAPAPLGGTLIDGTYQMSAARVFTGSGGPSGPVGVVWRAVHRLAGTEMSSAFRLADGSGEERSGTVGAAGTWVVVVESCPTSGFRGNEYTVVSPTELRLYEHDWDGGPYTAEYVFTRM